MLQNGIEIPGEKIIASCIHEIHNIKFQAYKLQIEEQRRLRVSDVMVYIPRKSRRDLTSTTQQNGLFRT